MPIWTVATKVYLLVSVLMFSVGLSFAILGFNRIRLAAESYERLPDEKYSKKFYFSSASKSDF